MKNIFKGLGVALVTPFTSEGAVDYDALAGLVERQIEQGADFLCILGTTAETPCLSQEEKESITRFVIDQAKGKVGILLGCGGNNTAALVAEIKALDMRGVDGILTVCPFYNKPRQEGIYQHFKAVAEATPLPIVLYNIPGRTGINLQADTVVRIATDCPNVVAVKEASGNISQIEEILERKPADFDVLSGDDAITYELLTMGAQGVISVVANVFTRQFKQMVDAAMQSRCDEALPIHHRFSELFKLLSVDGNPAGVKALIGATGLGQNVVRLPLVTVRKETQAAFEALVARQKEELQF